MNLEEMEVKILKALSHPIRLKILRKLSNQVLCVCELNKDVEFSQSNLSQHLKILKEANILNSEKKGSWIHYSIKNPEILQVIDIVESIIIKNIQEITENRRD